MTDEKRETTRRLEDQEVIERIVNLESNQDKFMDVLLGPEDAWGVRKSDKGLVGKVERIDHTLTNGGVRVKLPAGLWVLLAAITTGLFGVGIALIQAANNA